MEIPDKLLSFELITEQGRLFAQPVQWVDVPARTGRMTVMAGHQPFVAQLQSGPVKIVTKNGRRETWTIAGGLLKVTSQGAAVIAAEAHTV